MIISEKIFELMQKKGMTQKEFSERTGIAQSTISDWKTKHTNPISEKILVICEVLNVSPQELLSGMEFETGRNKGSEHFIVNKKSELGLLIEGYQSLDVDLRKRLMEYVCELKGRSMYE